MLARKKARINTRQLEVEDEGYVGLLENVKRLFPEAEAGIQDVEEEWALTTFVQFACRYRFRSDPRSVVSTVREIDTFVELIRSSFKVVPKTQRYFVTSIRRLMNSTKILQRAYRKFWSFKRTCEESLVRKWKKAENQARTRMRKEIANEHDDDYDGGLAKLVGNRRVYALRCLYNDCWTPDTLKLTSIRLLWDRCKEEYKTKLRAWKLSQQHGSTLRLAKLHEETMALSCVAGQFEFKKESKGLKTIIKNEPSFMDCLNPSNITISHLVATLEQCLASEPAKEGSHGRRHDHHWVKYYAELLTFNTKNVQMLINLYFTLSGKNRGQMPSKSRRNQTRARKRIQGCVKPGTMKKEEPEVPSSTCIKALKRVPQPPRKIPTTNKWVLQRNPTPPVVEVADVAIGTNEILEVPTPGPCEITARFEATYGTSRSTPYFVPIPPPPYHPKPFVDSTLRRLFPVDVCQLAAWKSARTGRQRAPRPQSTDSLVSAMSCHSLTARAVTPV